MLALAEAQLEDTRGLLDDHWVKASGSVLNWQTYNDSARKAMENSCLGVGGQIKACSKHLIRFLSYYGSLRARHACEWWCGQDVDWWSVLSDVNLDMIRFIEAGWPPCFHNVLTCPHNFPALHLSFPFVSVHFHLVLF